MRLKKGEKGRNPTKSRKEEDDEKKEWGGIYALDHIFTNQEERMMKGVMSMLYSVEEINPSMVNE